MAAIASLIIYLGIAALFIFITMLFRRLCGISYSLNENSVVLELTPPVASNKSPLATEQLFAHLYHSFSQTNWYDRVVGRQFNLSLEVVSSRQKGIRYFARLPAQEVTLFKEQLAAYLPGLKIREVDDYISLNTNQANTFVMEFKQTRHFAYPLASHDSLAEHDPIAYIASSMNRLAPNEQVALQIVITPTRIRSASRVRNKLYPSNDPHSPHNQETKASVQEKLSKPLFQATVRIMVSTDEPLNASRFSKGLSSAIAAFAVPGFQSLTSKRTLPLYVYKAIRKFWYDNRLQALTFRQGCILSVSEIAALYHFPYDLSAGDEQVVHTKSKYLAASSDLKARVDNKKYDIILGQNQHNGDSTDIGLTAAERERHVYIIGGTGNGKTTLLEYGIVQDIRNGHGIAIVDPHGDLAESLLNHIPKERLDDVIYFNPDDLDHPIGLNVLELTKGLSGNALLREKEVVTESVISIFRKVFSEDDSGGHRIEYILRNTIQTALTIPNSTLFTIYQLLNDPVYRIGAVSNLSDPNLQRFWQHEIGKAGNFQRVKMMNGITAKVGRFLFSASAKSVLEQPVSTINFDDILDSSKILICNFSKGLLGEDTAALFGTCVLAKLQLAALHRARLNPTKRRPFYLYIDELQHFATSSFSQMLSEARKYKVFLNMAEQSTAQQNDRQFTEALLANVGTVICFRSASQLDEQFVLPLFKPYLQAGDITNLPAYNFYAKISAIEPLQPVSGNTILLPVIKNNAAASDVKRISRQNYSTKFTKLAKPVTQAREVKVYKVPYYKPGSVSIQKQSNT